MDQALIDQYVRVAVEVEKLCSLLNVVHDSCEDCNWQHAQSSSDWCCWCSVQFEAGSIHNCWEPRKKQETKKVEASSHE